MVPRITAPSCCRAGGAMPKDENVKKATSEAAPDQRWKLQVFYLCFYGFMTQIRPGESFITPYLLGPEKNFTQAEVTNVITPVLTYSYMAVLVPIFLLTDYLCYKPVLVLQSLSHISIWLLLVFGTSILAMQLMEFFYGVTMAARIAYSSYIFSLVAPSRYQRMASYSRSAVLLGVFTSSVLGQLCVTLGSVSFLTLNYVSLGFVTFGLLLTLFLERPRRSLFFNRSEGAGSEAVPTELDKMAGGDSGRGPRDWQDAVLCRMLREVGALAQQPQLRLWSLWWVFNSAGYYLMLYYVQILWNEIYPTTDNRQVFNGGVDAASTLLGMLTWAGDTRNWGGMPPSHCVLWEWWSFRHFGGCRGGLAVLMRGWRLLCRRLREDSLDPVVRAGDWDGDGFPGRAASAYEHHKQHLAVLCCLRLLPWFLPVPGACRHFPDCYLPLQRALCSDLRGQHLLRHCAEDHHHHHCG
ncbi:reduced folate transporter isoform X2 [Heliangelus exortis]|uniref:reduced folate transporter isoform X2 n=1 Tax=Heliangelus exortis TaxID=472823 RepID=UPI003A8F2128